MPRSKKGWHRKVVGHIQLRTGRYLIVSIVRDPKQRFFLDIREWLARANDKTLTATRKGFRVALDDEAEQLADMIIEALQF